MKMEKGSISPNDLTFAVFSFMLATALRSGYIIGITRQDSWAMAITGCLFSLPIVAIYGALLKKFPGKNLFEIDDIIFGGFVGKVVSGLYLFFFLSLAALNMRDVGNFVADFLMPGTPLAAVFIIFLIACAYGIRKGIHNLMHLSTLFCIITVAAVVINTILVLKDAQPGFLKPFFRLELAKYIQGTISVGALPLGEILAFTMLTPMLEKNANATKPFFLGLIYSAISMAVLIIRDIITLGPLVAIVSLPSFESVRYISLAGVLTRLESIYAVILTLLFLFKISVLLYASALGLTQMLNKHSSIVSTDSEACEAGQDQHKKNPQPPLLLVCTALVFFYSLFVFESVMENRAWGATVAPFFSLTFEFLLPAVALLTAILRKLGKPKEVDL